MKSRGGEKTFKGFHLTVHPHLPLFKHIPACHYLRHHVHWSAQSDFVHQLKISNFNTDFDGCETGWRRSRCSLIVPGGKCKHGVSWLRIFV